jgi:predicted MFS family arabinose efflux permease
MSEPAAGEFRRGWQVLVAAATGVACGLSGIPFYSISSFIAPLKAEFGWSAAAIGVTGTIVVIGNFFTGPIVGHYCDRYGVRRLAVPSIALLALALGALGLVHGSLLTLYVGYALVVLGGAATTSVTYTRVVTAWFKRSRGLALGITMAGSGVIAIITPLLLAHVIGAWGWRAGFAACALVTLIPMPLVRWMLRERPPATAEADRPIAGATPGAAVRDRRFWTMVAAAMLFSPAISAVVIHLQPILTGIGLSAPVAAHRAALLGVGIILGRFLSGTLLDRLYGPLVAMLLFIMPAIGYLMLYSEWISLTPFAVLIVGMSLGAEGDVFAYFVSRYFGLRSYAELFGWIFGVMCLAGALGPLLILALPVAHGYSVALRLFAGLCVIAALLLATLGRYPDWNQPPPVRGAPGEASGAASE